MSRNAAPVPRDMLDTLARDGPAFAEPWQARIFALVSRMCMDGHCTWDAFRALLVDEIRNNGAEDGHDYHERWLAAAERLVKAAGMAGHDDLAARKEHLARHPPHPASAAPGPVAVDPPIS